MKHYSHLSFAEREEISRGLARGDSLRTIAGTLSRHPSTISREIRQNSCYGGSCYRAHTAGKLTQQRSTIPRRSRRLCTNQWLWQYVTSHLREEWSPEQIAATLQRSYAQEVDKHISYETIYATLYILPRGTLKTELLSCLRRRHRRRRKRGLIHDRRGQIPNMVSIQDRPAEADERQIPGHWEGDLLVGRNRQSALGVLTERSSRLTLLAKVTGQDAAEVRRAFRVAFSKIPAELKRSLTYDRGKEMSQHEQFTRQTKVLVYFCDPQSPWQRGTNENTNGLLRQYFPKGTDFTQVSGWDLRHAMNRLNTRPRKTLEWQTPLEVWQDYVERVAIKS